MDLEVLDAGVTRTIVHDFTFVNEYLQCCASTDWCHIGLRYAVAMSEVLKPRKR